MGKIEVFILSFKFNFILQLYFNNVMQEIKLVSIYPL